MDAILHFSVLFNGISLIIRATVDIFTHPVYNFYTPCIPTQNWFSSITEASPVCGCTHIPYNDLTIGICRGQSQTIRCVYSMVIVFSCPFCLDYRSFVLLKSLQNLIVDRVGMGIVNIFHIAHREPK